MSLFFSQPSGAFPLIQNRVLPMTCGPSDLSRSLLLPHWSPHMASHRCAKHILPLCSLLTLPGLCQPQTSAKLTASRSSGRLSQGLPGQSIYSPGHPHSLLLNFFFYSIARQAPDASHPSPSKSSIFEGLTKPRYF